jgi:DNA-binding LacI/PurR family transcriptional regulator
MHKKHVQPRTTISDIARETGYSIATVSRVINQTNTSYSEKTRKKIEAAIERMQYKPDMIARSLKERCSYSIVLLTPQIDEFYAVIYSSMNTIAVEKGYSVTWLSSQSNLKIQDYNLSLIRDKNYDGIVIATGLLGEQRDIREQFGFLPIVMIESTTEIQGISRVYVNVEDLCSDAVKYLVSHGHRDIAYISAPLQFDTLRDRYKGYRRGLEECGIHFNESLVFFDSELTRSDYEGSYRLMRSILSNRRFSAMLVISDWAAFTAIKAARQLAIDVPQNLSIVGFDNLPFTNFCDPPLTTVSQNQQALGENAMHMILELIDGKPARAACIHGEVVYRSSVVRKTG